MTMNDPEQNKRDLRTLVIRLLNESEDTMSPETVDVMRRLAPGIMAEIGLTWTWPSESAAADDELNGQWDNFSRELDPDFRYSDCDLP